ncbi:SagB family peptide dehydrogenase [bacterium]|nr:SagB family peptide dehydrogenase [bacterium]
MRTSDRSCWPLVLAAVWLVVGCRSIPPGSPPESGQAYYRLGARVRLVRDGDAWVVRSAGQELRIPVAHRADSLLVQELQSTYLPVPAVAVGSVVQRLLEQHCLTLQLRVGPRTLVTVEPAPALTEPGAAGETRLSRFAYLHRVDDQWLLESPLSPHRVTIHDPALLPGLMQSGPTPNTQSGPSSLWGILQNAGFTVGTRDSEGRDGQGPLTFWSFHDLLFHGKTLSTRQGHPATGTFRWLDRVPVLPPVKPVVADARVVDLPAVTPAQRKLLEQPFGEVLQSRRSWREPRGRELTVGQLGGLLFAAAKLQRVDELPEHGDAISYRPSPSGGARHPLEIYALVRQCPGLEPGLYHYNPLGHQLETVALTGSRAPELSDWHPFAPWGSPPPPVILLVTARVGRTAWKYEDIAYRLIHNDLGALYQTLYLTATALGLGPCAIGNVDTTLFAAVTGIDDLAEPWIGAVTLYP